MLWGQSIGAGVAATAAANHAADIYAAAGGAAALDTAAGGPHVLPTIICGLVLETPFTSVRAMLGAIYPQKWMPYRYLWPFLRNHWDTVAALRRIGTTVPPLAAAAPPHFVTAAAAGASPLLRPHPPSPSPSSPIPHPPPPPTQQQQQQQQQTAADPRPRPRILILPAGKDELVPAAHSVEMEAVCRELGMDATRVEVAGALHTEVMAKAAGKRAVATFVREIGLG